MTEAKAQRFEQAPPLKFCPYCGSQRVRLHGYVPKCDDCRVTFFVQFGHRMRARKTLDAK